MKTSLPRLLSMMVLAVGAPVRAQDPPSTRLPFPVVDFPAFEERTLTNGATVLVVPHHELPFVTVDLVVPGGRASDPDRRVGLAEFTATLLTRGTTVRSAAELGAAVDQRGLELRGSAGPDWSTVSVAGGTDDLGEALDLMAEVVRSPSFPAEEVELLRARITTQLEGERGNPEALADRALLSTVYEDHPYGKRASIGSIAGIDRASIVAYHERWYRPSGALFVVAGDVEVDRAVAELERAFVDWLPAAAPQVRAAEVPVVAGPPVVLVHQPGASRAVVHLGQALPEASHPDWPTLVVLGEVLGGGPGSGLSGVLREALGLAVPVSTEVQRRRASGLMRIRMDVPTEAVVDALGVVLGQLEALHSQFIGPEPLRRARDVLVRSLPLQIETPQQVASLIAANRLLGLPDSAATTYHDRVGGVGPQDLMEASTRQIRAEDVAIVVVGDATRLYEALTSIDEVRVVDADGARVDPVALAPVARSEVLDASGLMPVRLEYRVSLQGQVLGTMTRSLAEGASPGTMVFRGVAQMAGQEVAQSVSFTVPDFRTVAADAELVAMGQSMSMAVDARDGRLVGAVRDADGERPVDRLLPDGALVGDMVELAVWIADLNTGVEMRAPGVQVETGTIEQVVYHVGPVEELTVPAGSFQAFRVEVSGGQPQTIWARVEPPHLPVKIEPAGPPVALELVSITVGG